MKKAVSLFDVGDRFFVLTICCSESDVENNDCCSLQPLKSPAPRPTYPVGGSR